MISQLTEYLALNLKSLPFSRISRTGHSAQSAAASLRAPTPFALRVQVSGFHHSFWISDTSTKGPREKQRHYQTAHIAARHKPTPRPLRSDEIPTDDPSLDGVPPEEGLRHTISCQSASTLDSNPNCDTAAYSKVGNSHSPSLAPLTTTI